MESSLNSTIDMIDRLLVYVRKVVAGEIEGDEKVGRRIMDELSEKVAGATANESEGGFNGNLQVSILFFLRVVWAM